MQASSERFVIEDIDIIVGLRPVVTKIVVLTVMNFVLHRRPHRGSCGGLVVSIHALYSDDRSSNQQRIFSNTLCNEMTIA